MKKLFFGLFVCSVGVNVYLLNTEVVVIDNLDSDMYEVDDQISVAQSALSKSMITKNRIADIKVKLKSVLVNDIDEKQKEEISQSELRAEADRYDKAVQKWNSDITEYLDGELGLSAEMVEIYFELKNQREVEINKYFLQAREKLNLSDTETYMYTIDDTIFIGKTSQKFRRKLRDEFGTDAYYSYKSFIGDYNKKSVKDQANGLFFTVDF